MTKKIKLESDIINIKEKDTQRKIGYCQGGDLILRNSSTGSTVLSGTGNSIILRPNGDNDDSGQVTLDHNGILHQNSQTIYNNSSGTVDFPISNYGKGLYYVRTADGDGLALYVDADTYLCYPRNNSSRLMLKIISASSNAILQAISQNSAGTIIAYPKITKITRLVCFN